MYPHRIATGLLLLACIAQAGACTIRDDSTRSNQIEDLRVLGIASEPPDLVMGETAHITALVFDQEARSLSYQWSWCLSRGDANTGFACNINEADLQAAWATLNTGVELPPYDLGSAESASFEMLFEPEQAIGLCQLLTQGAPDEQIALFTCLSGLGLSIELKVQAGDDEIVAIKEIPVLLADEVRNANPVIGDGLTRTLRGGEQLATDAPFVTEGIYDLVADISLDQSESFLPEAQDGLPPPEERGESLFLSWFVTVGSTHRKGDVRTAYFDEGKLESLTENTWDMPFDLEANEAKLFLVLRDERGGITWTQRNYALTEAP